MEGGAIISIFLITNQHQWSSMEVPLPCGRQQGLLYEGNSAAPPTWARALEGSPVDPATKTLFAKDQGDKESVGGAQGRRRREGAMQRVFHFHKKLKVRVFHFHKKWKWFQFDLYCCYPIICVSAWQGLDAESTSNKCFKIYYQPLHCSRRTLGTDQKVK